MAVKKRVTPRQVDIAQLQARLASQGVTVSAETMKAARRPASDRRDREL
jgi:hypothetical protein